MAGAYSPPGVHPPASRPTLCAFTGVCERERRTPESAESELASLSMGVFKVLKP